MSSILSIDYGLKRIGLAFSDSDRVFAFPLGIVENRSFEYIISELNKIIHEKEIDLILVGMPYNMPGLKSKKSEMAKKVEIFIKKLSNSFPKIKIKTFDERLSSFSAEENLKEAGISSKKSKKFVDTEAARLMLEEFLNKKI